MKPRTYYLHSLWESKRTSAVSRCELYPPGYWIGSFKASMICIRKSIHGKRRINCANQFIHPSLIHSFPIFPTLRKEALETVGIITDRKPLNSCKAKLLPKKFLKARNWQSILLSQVYRERKRLGNIKFSDGKMIINERKTSSVSPCPSDFSECLKTARSIFNRARKVNYVIY